MNIDLMLRINYTLLLLFTLCSCNNTPKLEGTFKSWNFSPRGVYGIVEIKNPNGVAHYRIKKNRNVTSIEHVNAVGRSINIIKVTYKDGRLLSHVTKNEWGASTLVMTFKYLNDNEVEVKGRKDGRDICAPCYAYRLKYDDYLLTELNYVHSNGTLCTTKSGRSVISYIPYQDSHRFGLNKELYFFDEKQTPMLDSDFGSHKVTQNYDNEGLLMSRNYFSVNGNPTNNNLGISSILYRYDSLDNNIDKEYLNTQGNLQNNINNIAKEVFEYKQNLVVKKTLFNERDEIIEYDRDKIQVPIIRHLYNLQGNETERTNYDRGENSIDLSNGIHKYVNKYNEKNLKTEELFFNSFGKRVHNEDGVYHYFHVYDEKGREIERAHYGLDDVPTLNYIDKVHIIKFKYDNENRAISKSYWTANNIKMDRWDGYSEQVMKYDTMGNLLETLYLDKNKQLTTLNTGESRQILKYDNENIIRSLSYFNGDKPIRIKENGSYISNFHSVSYNYNARLLVTKVSYFDEFLRPINANIFLDGTTIYSHQVEFIYKGKEIMEQKFYLAGSNIPFKFIEIKSNDTHVNFDGLGTINSK